MPTVVSEALLSPIEAVENLIEGQNWEAEKQEDEITIHMKGGWCDYQLRFTWMEEKNLLHLGCGFDIPSVSTEEQVQQLYTLILLANNKLWLGHFDWFHTAPEIVLFRQALPCKEEEPPTNHQLAEIFSHALETCDQYYAAFKLVLEGKEAQDAIAMISTTTPGHA